jgi:adenosylcobinamide-phosphate synthase
MGSRERLAGVFLAVVIAAFTYILFYLIQLVLLMPHTSILFSSASVLVLIYLTSTTIATRGLIDSGKAVIDEVRTGSITQARQRIGMIVGRDTKSLDRKGILKATIETLSENTSDGIVAPLFYFAIGGLPLAMTYKAINTLDSMVGYKNETYQNLGWASARLDDAVNFIPARLTGLLIVASTFILSALSSSADCLNGFNAFKIMIRDGRRHASPNSGIPEAAMAGALGIKLGGPSVYDGVVFEKSCIGDEIQSSDDHYSNASEKSITLTKIASLLGLLLAIAVLYTRTGLWN